MIICKTEKNTITVGEYLMITIEFLAKRNL